MSHQKIAELQRVFATRLDVLAHVLDVGERHFGADGFLDKRLADDMFPLSGQVALACNQPRGFSQWCAGQPIDNLKADSVATLAQARDAIAQTKAMVAGIAVGDAKLDETKRIGLGPGRYCELPGHQYVADYLLPNLYFHVTTAYAILRHAGAPIGKTDFMTFLAPHVRTEAG
jgi:hypothetical protein